MTLRAPAAAERDRTEVRGIWRLMVKRGMDARQSFEVDDNASPAGAHRQFFRIRTSTAKGHSLSGPCHGLCLFCDRSSLAGPTRSEGDYGDVDAACGRWA